jgi:hypothetical protein
LKHYHEVVVCSTAGVLTFCYTTVMPHYNFNIDMLVSWAEDDFESMNFDLLPLGCLATNMLNGSLSN